MLYNNIVKRRRLHKEIKKLEKKLWKIIESGISKFLKSYNNSQSLQNRNDKGRKTCTTATYGRRILNLYLEVRKKLVCNKMKWSKECEVE